MTFLFHNTFNSLLVEIADKTAFPNTIFKSSTGLSVLFINFICEMENTNVFEHLSLKMLKNICEKSTSTYLAICFSQTIGNVLNGVHTKTRNKLERSSHRRCSVKNGVIRNFVKFPGKQPWQSFFCNKVAGLILQLY